MALEYVFHLEGGLFKKSSSLKFEGAVCTPARQHYGLTVDGDTVIVWAGVKTYATDRPVSWTVTLTGYEARCERDDGVAFIVLPSPGKAIVYDDGNKKTTFMFTGKLLIPVDEE